MMDVDEDASLDDNGNGAKIVVGIMPGESDDEDDEDASDAAPTTEVVVAGSDEE
jgi:hypothetical protein